jgi:glycosyltransferase involved in cell wall biosynthesis
MKKENIYSVIILAYNSGDKIKVAYEKIYQLFLIEKIKFEFIIINDGSKDNNKTYSISKKLESEKKNVKYFELSRNFTSHYAAFAGLSKCSGDLAALIPDDEQQPYDTLVKSYRLWENGDKVIFPIRSSRDDPKTSRFFSGLFYGFMSKTTDYDYPKFGLDTWVIDREIIDILNNKISPRNTTTITEILYLGFDPQFIFYDRMKSTNEKSRWSFKKKLKLASDWFFTTTRFPIKLVTFLGIGSFLLSISMIIFYVYIKLFGDVNFWKSNQVPGWVSLVVIISFFSGVILLSLAMIAEYIWRIFEEVKQRPGYLIKQKSEH